MDDVHDRPGDNCTQFTGPVTVEGIQFTPSGGTLETFRFTDKNGTQWSVPTNIGRLSNVDRQHANSFIRVGKRYFVHAHGSRSRRSLTGSLAGGRLDRVEVLLVHYKPPVKPNLFTPDVSPAVMLPARPNDDRPPSVEKEPPVPAGNSPLPFV